jgi:hypothetical protein
VEGSERGRGGREREEREEKEESEERHFRDKGGKRKGGTREIRRRRDCTC